MLAKTSELQGEALDWAVAKCEGATGLRFDTVACWWFTLNGIDRVLSKGWSAAQNYAPSTDWAQGGPIIEREKISTEEIQGAWKAELEHLTADDADYRYGLGYGPTPLIAAMRCYVASKLGEEVDIPDDLAA